MKPETVQKHLNELNKSIDLLCEENTILRRALLISAKIMEADNLCIHESQMHCHRIVADPVTCDQCMTEWLYKKAQRELKKEASLMKEGANHG